MSRATVSATLLRVSLASLALAHAASGEDLEKLSWLAGEWRAETGRVTIEEHWIPPSGGMMLGVSRSVANGKTVGFEFLRLEVRENGVFYVAQPNGKPGADFELTRIDRESAVFENPEHDHPKVIRYRRNADGTLWAKIEGDEGASEFHFRPITEGRSGS